MNQSLMLLDTMTNKGYLEIANSPMMWAMVIPTLIVVCLQAYIFIRDAVKAGPIVGLTSKETKEAMRAGAICSIGPALSMSTVMIAVDVLLIDPRRSFRLAPPFNYRHYDNRNAWGNRRSNRHGRGTGRPGLRDYSLYMFRLGNHVKYMGIFHRKPSFCPQSRKS